MRRRIVLTAVLLALGPCGTARAGIVPAFRSPSGNIACAFVARDTRLFCTIERSRYSQQLQDWCMRPNGAGLDWHGFEIGASGRAHVTCSGGLLVVGTVRYVTVPYGASWRRGPFTCASRVDGVTCRSRAAHGLFLAREHWRAW